MVKIAIFSPSFMANKCHFTTSFKSIYSKAMRLENRKHKRVILKRLVTLNDSLKMMGLDLSEGGIYVHTGRFFPVGLTLDLLLPLDKGDIKIKARVQHTQYGIGMGLMFIDLSSENLSVIRDFIENSSVKQEEAIKKKVLIVDDNASSRRMNKSKLVLDGFEVLEAADGFEAIALLEKEAISLVVLDLYMDKLDGFKVLSIMRQKPAMINIPVLVFSARTNPKEIERAMSAGATEFLPKMITTPVKLSERVKQYHLSRQKTL